MSVPLWLCAQECRLGRDQKRATDPPGAELQAVGSHQYCSSEKAADILTY